MSDTKVIVVLGATGAQGGGLVEAILGDPEGGFSVRAVTRNPESDTARALAARGAEVVQADLNDRASLEAAFEGAYGAFCVTNFWEHFSPEKELEQAKNLAEAAAAAGVQHVVWSTLDDTRKWVPLEDDRMPTLQGKYKVPHFDAKGEANRFFEEAGVPTTFMNTVFYWDNFIHFGSGPQPGPDGTLALTFPMGDARLPSIAVEDIGKCAYGVFKREDLIGETIGIAGGYPTIQEMADVLTEALGEKVVYNDVDPDVYRSFDFPGAEDLGNMFQFKRDFEDEYVASRSVELSRSLNPELQSFEDWVARNAERIPIEAGAES